MSYASVAATNAPPLSQQPHPDPRLLNLDTNDIHKGGPDRRPYSPSANDPNHRAQRLHDIEQEGSQMWETLKEYALRPSVAGGLVGLVNVGLLSGIGRAFYIYPEYRRSPSVVSSTIAAALFLVAAEGYVAEACRRTPEGKAAEKRARQEGSAIYKHLREVILRPGYLGGLVGVVNLGVFGIVGYYSYQNWDRSWDQRVVTGTTAGLIALLAGEGLAAEQYSKTPEGKEAQRKAKEEGSAAYKQLNNLVWRPGVMGGLVGLVNVGVLGTIAYCAYLDWDKPEWDKPTMAAVAAGLVTLWAGEGYIAERYYTTK